MQVVVCKIQHPNEVYTCHRGSVQVLKALPRSYFLRPLRALLGKDYKGHRCKFSDG